MRLKSFIKDKILYIFGLFFIVSTIEIVLMTYKINNIIRLYILIAPMVVMFLLFVLEYIKKKKFYSMVESSMDELDEKYLISEVINDPDFIEGRLLKSYLSETGKSMKENVNKYKFLQEEYKDYIELWIHEIKLPISVAKLIIENNKNNVTENIDEEIDKIENFIEQALYYARSNNVEKDYIIKKVTLKEIVNTTIMKNKKALIENNINLDIHDIDTEVYIDNKWTIFILNQIIQNCIKYSKKDNKKIEIYSSEYKERTILTIKDNGIGISTSDITRIFDKGFTGKNGRLLSRKSTGLGLYLVKKLCNKMGMNVEIDSKENVGTSVKLIFPKASYYLK